MEDSCRHAAAADAMDDAATDAPGDAAACAMDPRPSPAHGTVRAARTAEAARTTRNALGRERQRTPGRPHRARRGSARRDDTSG